LVQSFRGAKWQRQGRKRPEIPQPETLAETPHCLGSRLAASFDAPGLFNLRVV
jgi:hypothetical protein